MKIFNILIFLIFSTVSNANDIYDLEIEGISVGDSALDYFSINEINKSKKDYYENKEYTAAIIENKSFFKTYEDIQINFLTQDKNYIIENISGNLYITYSYCLIELDKMINEFNEILVTGTFYDKETFDHPNGSGDVITDVYWDLTSGNVLIQCYDRSGSGNDDVLNVAIDTKEFFKFIVDKAYK